MVAPLLLGAYSAVESDEAFCASLWDCQTLGGKRKRAMTLLETTTKITKPQPALLSFNDFATVFSQTQGGICWVWPLPSKSDHQDYSIFSRESL